MFPREVRRESYAGYPWRPTLMKDFCVALILVAILDLTTIRGPQAAGAYVEGPSRGSIPSPTGQPVSPSSLVLTTAQIDREWVSAAALDNMALERGALRLAELQNKDGSWGATRDAAPRDTHVALEALRRAGATNSPAYRTGINWFRSLEPDNNDYLARQLHALSMAGDDVSGRRYQLVNKVLEGAAPCRLGTVEGRCQQLGFRSTAFGNYMPDFVTSSLAISALTAAGYREDPSWPTVVPYQVFWLMVEQNADGGWGFVIGDQSRVLSTALALEAMSPYRAESVHTAPVGPAFDRGLAWLKAQQNSTSGAWGEGASGVRQTSLALAAILEVGGTPTNLVAAVTYLQNSQQPDGGWGSSYDTAVTVRALAAAGLTPPATPSRPVRPFFRYAGDTWLALPGYDTADASAGVVESQFNTNVKQSNRGVSVTVGTIPSDFRLMLQARRTAGTTGAYGVQIGVGSQGYTEVVIRPQQREVVIDHWDAAANKMVNLLYLANVPGVNGAGLPNTLQLGVVGQRLTIAANGHQVGSFVDPQYVPGQVKLRSFTFSEPGFSVNWDFIEAAPLPQTQGAFSRALFRLAGSDWQQISPYDVPSCSLSIAEGRLVQQMKSAFANCTQRLGPGLGDFTVVAQVQQTAGTSGEYFLDVGSGPAGFTRVRVLPASRIVNVFHWNALASQSSTLFDQAGLEGVNQGYGANELRVNVQGQEVQVFVNDREVARVVDPQYVPGVMRLGAGAYDVPGFTVAWDSVEATTFVAPDDIVRFAGDTWRVLGTTDSAQYQRILQDGELRTTVKLPNLGFQESIARPASDFRATAQVHRVAATTGAYGLVLGKGANGFTVFRIAPQTQAVVVDRWDAVAQSWNRLFEQANVAAVSPMDGLNTLRADVIGQRIELYVNDQRIATVVNDKYRSGEVALETLTFADGGLSAA